MNLMKICVNGADYILCRTNDSERAKRIAERAPSLCDRYTGIGAQGIICAGEYEGKNTFDIISPNGEKRAFDADAAVCFAVAEGKKETVVTMSGGRLVVAENGSSDVYDVTFDKAVFLPSEVPLACSYPVIEKAVETGNRIILLTALRIGGVYAVHETYDLEKPNIPYLGEQITAHSLFLKKADAVFVQRIAEQTVKLRCYRRGGGVVLSDIGAAAAALVMLCRVGRQTIGIPVNLAFDRGEVTAVCRKDMSVHMKTQAKVVFEGNIDL